VTTVNTIGFAAKSLEQFVDLLKEAGVTKLIDVRLRPGSQLSGFARGGDLQYVLERYEHIEYVHAANLAPTDAILDGVRKSKDWDAYLAQYSALMRERKMQAELHRLIGDHERVALLCSEAKATTCHRGVLAAAYAKAHRAEVVDL
jgi:uncharacterized protein (DUF488 family)